ncbi:chromatin associated protein KTI12-domain-containing protein [Hyaloraphidium curvatum]|nr:chromatin associated protein KTI12-domain-containing protein [Hyaloraphidium curvatum]
MPLVLLTGYPCSGKTTRAKQLKELFETRVERLPAAVVVPTKTIASQGVLDASSGVPAPSSTVARQQTPSGTEAAKPSSFVKSSFRRTAPQAETERVVGTVDSDTPPSAADDGQPNGESSGSSSEKDRWTVHVINDEMFGSVRSEAYKNANEEKKFRAMVMSSVERLVSKDTIVIVDAMNAIKGYRYQLYCVAKALPTQHCVIKCDCPRDTAKQWNKERDSDSYTTEQMDDLITRYEEPIETNRWDSPLYTLAPDDDLLDAVPSADSDVGDTRFDQIARLVLSRAPPKQNMSTMRNPITQTNYVQNVDKLLNDVIQAIQSHQASYGAYASPQCPIPDCQLKVDLPPRIVSAAELRRLKRGFENLNKLRRVEDMGRAVETFVEYLNGVLR